MNLNIDIDFTTDFLFELLTTPSPTGNTEQAMAFIEKAFQRLGLKTERTVKGALLITIPGQNEAAPCAITGHVDTLGGMVKEIKTNGRLAVTNLGGYYPGSIVGEYCTIETEDGRSYTGTVVLSKQSVHIHPMSEVHDSAQHLNKVEIRLDARTGNRHETAALGIQVGDFISWDARANVTPQGFIKSRHLDDKAAVAVMLGVAKTLYDHKITPHRTTHLYISNYEEVGHGGAVGIPADVEDLLVVDMGVVGQGHTGTEYSVSICAKDGSGPYDLSLRRRLTTLAKKHDIDYNVDVYVNYSSDGSAAWRAGNDFRIALLGPGVESSHAYERTHQDALANTAKLLLAYLQTE